MASTACFRRWISRGAIGIASLLALGSTAVVGEETAPAETVVRKRKEPARLQLTGGEAEIKSNAAAAEVPPLPAGKTAAAAPRPPAALPADTAATPAAPAAGGAVTLRYKFAVNQQTYYSVNHVMKITTQKDQTSETAQNESDTVRHFRVVSVEADGSAILELMIDRVKMSARFGENDPITYDSAGKPAAKPPAKPDEEDSIAFDSTSPAPPPPLFKNIVETIGKPTARIKVSPTGEMLDVVRMNAPAPNPAAPEVADNDPSNNFLVILPAKAVKPGDTWSDKIDVRVALSKALTQNITILRKYELVSVKDSVATIATDSTVITPIRDPQINGQLIQRTPEGTVRFDIAQGQILSREMKLNKTEIGVFGDNSSMRAVSTRVEKLVTREAALQTAGGKEPALK